MSLITPGSIEESIGEFNDYSFDLENVIGDANDILIKQKEIGLFLQGDFESDEWRFLSPTRHTSVYFNFKETKQRLKFKNVNTDKIVLALKCWIAILIPTRSIESLRKYYKYVEDFLSVSRVFEGNLLERVQNYLTYECDDRTRWNLCVPTLNFIDFYDEIDNTYLYQSALIDIKKDIDIDKVGGLIRTLPPAKDVLAFSWVLENFFIEEDLSNKKKLRYYPIYIWWTLSNLIPMRPSEFCDISRNALSTEKDRYYIQLPRLKQKKNKHKIQIVDKISIPKKIYYQLEKYITETESYGETITLISYGSIRIRNASQSKTHLNKRFKHANLQVLLEDFYKEVVEKEYQMSYEYRVRPGDTRHFAFLNLMRQGYHAVEIARLGGHTTLQAQYHYQQHMEYWVDIEIIQLMQRFSLYKEASQDKTNSYFSFHLDEEFLSEKVLKINNTEVNIDLDIGYCTDPDMYCQVEKCYFCGHWRISQEEYLLKRVEIEDDLKQCKSDVSKLVKTLNNLYNVALKEAFEDDFSELNTEFNRDLFLTKSQLDEKVHKILNFSSKLTSLRKDELI